jgi:hypothetical protein
LLAFRPKTETPQDRDHEPIKENKKNKCLFLFTINTDNYQPTIFIYKNIRRSWREQDWGESQNKIFVLTSTRCWFDVYYFIMTSLLIHDLWTFVSVIILKKKQDETQLLILFFMSIFHKALLPSAFSLSTILCKFLRLG